MVIKVLHLTGLFHVQQLKKGPLAAEQLFLAPSHLSPITGVYKLICIMNIPCLPLQSFAWHTPNLIVHSTVFHGDIFMKRSVLFCCQEWWRFNIRAVFLLHTYCQRRAFRWGLLRRLSSGLAVKLLLIVRFCLVPSSQWVVLFLVLLSGWQISTQKILHFYSDCSQQQFLWDHLLIMRNTQMPTPSFCRGTREII